MLVVLPDRTNPKAPWVYGLVETLAQGLPGLGVEIRREPTAVYRHAPRYQQSCTIVVNGCDVVLDTWDYSCPTWQILEVQRPDESRVHAVLKIQTRKETAWPGAGKIPVVPWTMFHTAQLDWFTNLVCRREQIAMTPKKYDAGFTGRMWRDRQPWVSAMPKGYDVSCWSGRQRNGNTDDWIDRAATWRVGIIFKGKADRMTDGKNRREVEFASLRVPMVLNYKPWYGDQWPLVPGHHYIYCDKPGDIESAVNEAKARSLELTSAAWQWWNEVASPHGACWSFVRLMIRLGLEDENNEIKYSEAFKCMSSSSRLV